MRRLFTSLIFAAFLFSSLGFLGSAGFAVQTEVNATATDDGCFNLVCGNLPNETSMNIAQNSTGHLSVSYMLFNVTNITNKVILSATLKFNVISSAVCTGGTFGVNWRAVSNIVANGSKWEEEYINQSQDVNTSHVPADLSSFYTNSMNQPCPIGGGLKLSPIPLTSIPTYYNETFAIRSSTLNQVQASIGTRENSGNEPIMIYVLDDFFTNQSSTLTSTVFFDFESRTASGSSFEGADFSYNTATNTMTPLTVTQAFLTTETSEANTLNNVDCSLISSGSYTSNQAIGINVPSPDNDIFCFNISSQHGGKQFYAAVKFTTATNPNTTFFHASYSPSYTTFSNIAKSPDPPVSSQNVTIFWQTTNNLTSVLRFRFIQQNGNFSGLDGVQDLSGFRKIHALSFLTQSFPTFYEFFLEGMDSSNNTFNSSVFNFTSVAGAGVPTVPTGVAASIVNFSGTRTPLINSINKYVVAVKNTGNVTHRFKIGFSIGFNETGQFCNSDCYVSGSVDPYTATTWFSIINITPDETRILTADLQGFTAAYQFRSPFFNVGDTFDVKISVRPEATLDILDLEEFTNFGTIVQASTQNITVPITVFVVDKQNKPLFTAAVVMDNFPTAFALDNCQDLGGGACARFFPLPNETLGIHNVTVFKEGFATQNRLINVTAVPFLTTFIMQDNGSCFVASLFQSNTSCLSEMNFTSNPTIRNIFPSRNVTGFQCKFDPDECLSFNETGHCVDTSKGLWVGSFCTDGFTPVEGLGVLGIGSAIGGSGITNVVPLLINPLAQILGLNSVVTQNFLAMLISTLGAVAAGIKTREGLVASLAFLGLMTMFLLIGWLPIWVLVIMVVITAFLLVRSLHNVFTPA